jgi:hypothetical protein
VLFPVFSLSSVVTIRGGGRQMLCRDVLRLEDELARCRREGLKVAGENSALIHVVYKPLVLWAGVRG